MNVGYVIVRYSLLSDAVEHSAAVLSHHVSISHEAV